MKAECKRNQAAINYYVRLYGSDRAVPFPGSYGLEMAWGTVRAALFRDALGLGNHTDPYEQRYFMVL